MSDEEKLVQTVGGEDLRWIWERVRSRILRGQECRGIVRLADPTEPQRRAAAALFGRRPRGSGLTISLSELEELLRGAGLAESLEKAASVVLQEDPADVRARKLEQAQQWDTALAAIREDTRTAPEVARQVVQEITESGLLRRLSEGTGANAARLVDGLLRLGDRLPGNGVPLAQLAAEVAGDAHALDEGAPLGTLATRLAARFARVVPGEDPAEDRREIWASAGVLCDELSAPALALNLAVEGDDALAEILRVHAAVGEPVRVSIRQLVRSRPTFRPCAEIFVCENPSVLAAAANALGRACPPMVCTEGMPRSAVRLLIDGLTRTGALPRFHTDFDWAGVRIGNLLVTRHGAVPWRMSADDYRAGPPGPQLEARAVPARWAEALDGAMTARGVAVHEEAVMARLLEDLQR